MCIKITKDLKQVYENEMQIDLGKKIFYPTFCMILTHLGYLEHNKNQSESRQFRGSGDQLVKMAWSTIRTKCPVEENLLDVTEESGPNERENT